MAVTKYRKTSNLIALYDKAEWVALPAIILSSSVRIQRIPRSSASLYFLIVSYRYKHSGTEYISSTIGSALPEGMCSNEAMANKLTTLLSSGSNITAFVNKNSPSTAVLSLSDVIFTPSSKVWSYALITLFGSFGLFSSLVSILYIFGKIHA